MENRAGVAGLSASRHAAIVSDRYRDDCRDHRRSWARANRDALVSFIPRGTNEAIDCLFDPKKPQRAGVEISGRSANLCARGTTRGGTSTRCSARVKGFRAAVRLDPQG